MLIATLAPKRERFNIAASPADRNEYVYGIDLVRFAAAYLVVLFHFTWTNREAAGYGYFGWIGVQIFFVISGLVIANSASNRTPGDFLQSRFLRIYPAAVACAAINALALWAKAGSFGIGELEEFAKSVVLWPRGPWLGSAYRTLPIELSFYTAIYVLLRVGEYRQIGTLACWLILLAAPYLIFLAAYSDGLIWLPRMDYNYGLPNLLLLRHGPYFALGVLIHLDRQREFESRHRAFALLALLEATLEIYLRSSEYLPKYGAPFAVGAVFFSTWSIWLLSVALICLAQRYSSLFVPTGFARLVVRRVGLMTYPLYLCHECVGFLVLTYFLRLGSPRPIGVLVAIVSVGLLSFLIAGHIEPAVRGIFRNWIIRVPQVMLSETLPRGHPAAPATQLYASLSRLA